MNSLVKVVTPILDRIGLSRSGRIRRWMNGIYSRLLGPTEREKATPFNSFSQFGEDAFLNSILRNQHGRYVDVGSGHPIRGSNTYALYESGWRGVLIDPLPANVTLSRALRPCDTVIEACCGSEHGFSCFYAVDTYEFSSRDSTRFTDMIHQGEVEILNVEVITLASLNLTARPQENVVLSIDVEGDEMEVLEGMDWAAFTPGIIVIEEHAGPLAKASPIYEYLLRRSYKLVAVLGISSIYQHTEHLAVTS